MDSLESPLEFLNVVLVGFKQWNKCSLILVQDRTGTYGLIEFCIFLPWFNVKLTVQIA